MAVNQKSYTEAEVNQAKDLYIRRGIRSLRSISRFLNIPHPTLTYWRDKYEWDSDIVPSSPVDMAFLLHLVRLTLSKELIALNDSSLENDFESVKDRTQVISQLSRTLESISKALDEFQELTFEFAVSKFEEEAKKHKDLTDDQKEIFLAVLSILHSDIMGDE